MFSEIAISGVATAATVTAENEVTYGLMFKYTLPFWIGVGLFFVKMLVEFSQKKAHEKRLFKEAMVDFLVELKFLRRNYSEVLSPAEIERIKCLVCHEGKRGYVYLYKNAKVYENIQTHRHQLKIDELELLHELVEYINLLYGYYEMIGSDAFKELNNDRKGQTLDQLGLIGKMTLELSDNFLALETIKQFSNQYSLDVH